MGWGVQLESYNNLSKQLQKWPADSIAAFKNMAYLMKMSSNITLHMLCVSKLKYVYHKIMDDYINCDLRIYFGYECLLTRIIIWCILKACFSLNITNGSACIFLTFFRNVTIRFHWLRNIVKKITAWINRTRPCNTSRSLIQILFENAETNQSIDTYINTSVKNTHFLKSIRMSC